MSREEKEVASFPVMVRVTPDRQHQLLQDMLRAVNEMRGYPDGRVPMISTEEIEAQSPGLVDAHRRLSMGVAAHYEATMHVDRDGHTTLTIKGMSS